MISLAELNRLANHPNIMPVLAPGYEWIDLARAYSKPGILLVGDSLGVIMMVPCDNPPTVMEWHWLLTPCVRGAKALRLARAAINEAFTHPNICAIVGATPRCNRAARLMNRALGARPTGLSVDSHGRECINYMLERDPWATSLRHSLAALVH